VEVEVKLDPVCGVVGADVSVFVNAALRSAIIAESWRTEGLEGVASSASVGLKLDGTAACKYAHASMKKCMTNNNENSPKSGSCDQGW
jgi:hypothetical protein